MAYEKDPIGHALNAKGVKRNLDSANAKRKSAFYENKYFRFEGVGLMTLNQLVERGLPGFIGIAKTPEGTYQLVKHDKKTWHDISSMTFEVLKEHGVNEVAPV